MKQSGETFINTFPGTTFYLIIYFTWKLFYPFTKTSHKMIQKGQTET